MNLIISSAYSELASRVNSEAVLKGLEVFRVKHRDLVSRKLEKKHAKKLGEVISKSEYFWWVLFLRLLLCQYNHISPDFCKVM